MVTQLLKDSVRVLLLQIIASFSTSIQLENRVSSSLVTLLLAALSLISANSWTIMLDIISKLKTMIRLVDRHSINYCTALLVKTLLSDYKYFQKKSTSTGQEDKYLLPKNVAEPGRDFFKCLKCCHFKLQYFQ